MTIQSGTTVDERVIVLAPTPRDADAAVSLLTDAGVPACAYATFDIAIEEARRGAAAFLLPEEALHAEGRAQMAALVDAQPPWSDLPLLVLTHAGADSSTAREAAATLGNVTLLERPLRIGTLISAVRTALRARERQYQIRTLLAEHARVEAALREREERQAFLLTLTDALRPIARAADVQAVAMRVLCEHVGADRAQYLEVEPDGTQVHAALAAGRTRTAGSYVGVPLVKAGRLAAVVCAHRTGPHDWTPAEIAVVEDAAQRTWAEVERARAEEALADAETRFLADLEGRVQERTTALALANASLQAEVRERRAAERQIQALYERVVSVQEEERRRIARDLHDQLGQQMTALRMRLEAILPWLNGDPSREEHATRTQQLAEELDRNIDRLTWELRPAVLERVGLRAALRGLVAGWSERFGIDASFKATRAGDLRLPQDAEANLYRLVQEALHNVVKHAHAHHVDVRLQARPQDVVLAVQDDGRGFDLSVVRQKAGAGLGLTSMRERATLAGGGLEVDTSPGHGTTVVVKVRRGSSDGKAPPPGEWPEQTRRSPGREQTIENRSHRGRPD